MDNQDQKNIYDVFRVSDCSRICKFDCTDFHLCKQITSPVPAEYDCVQAIIDKKTHKIYPANIRTILHLSSGGAHLFAEDMDSIKREDNKLEIFGLPVPSLLPMTFSDFKKM